jgi:hypothetical protein
VANSAYRILGTLIEDVRTFAGQTVTVSMWLKSPTPYTLGLVSLRQNFGSGGSSRIDTTVASNISITSSWQRFTWTTVMPSISGKTIGTGSFVDLILAVPPTAASTTDIWGVQLEAGSVATPFSRAGGTLQGELAACQRYYWRSTGGGQTYGNHRGQGFVVNSTTVEAGFALPVPMRTPPTSVEYGSGVGIGDSANVGATASAISLYTIQTSNEVAYCTLTISGGTAGRWAQVRNNNNAAGYIGFSAEL